MSRILLIGNSHSQTIKDCPQKLDGLSAYWLRTKAEAVQGDIELPAACELIAALGADDCLILMRLGSTHNVIGLLNHDQPFALLDGLAPEDTADMIPRAVMRQYLDDAMQSDTVLPRLTDLAKCRVAHIMTPPPKKDLAGLKVPAKAYRGRKVTDYGFSPAPRRLALWRLEQQVLDAYLARLGVSPIAPPAAALTPEGYLHPDFCAPDATHANAAYGALLLDQIRDFAGNTNPKAA